MTPATPEYLMTTTALPPVLASAIAQQQARIAAQAAPAPSEPATDSPTLEETLRISYRMGAAVLAWCVDHPFQVGRYQHLVEQLRQAMARRELIQPIVSEIWASVPGAARVRALPAPKPRLAFA